MFAEAALVAAVLVSVVEEPVSLVAVLVSFCAAGAVVGETLLLPALPPLPVPDEPPCGTAEELEDAVGATMIVVLRVTFVLRVTVVVVPGLPVAPGTGTGTPTICGGEVTTTVAPGAAVC